MILIEYGRWGEDRDDGEALARRIAKFWYGHDVHVGRSARDPWWEINRAANDLKLDVPSEKHPKQWRLHHRYTPPEESLRAAVAQALAYLLDVTTETEPMDGLPARRYLRDGRIAESP